MKRTHAQIRLIARMILAVLCLSGVALAQSTFDEQQQSVSTSLVTQPESAILNLLTAGLDENKPTQAFALAQQWLKENIPQNPLVLYHAARSAELSGEWNDAVALYQQYLKRADLKSDTASDAVMAVYVLLTQYLLDDEGAYTYARTEGHRLVVIPQARQFDRGFLDRAESRNDVEAVAARLLALVRAGLSNDQLQALHDSDFHWLLDAVAAWRIDEKRFKPGFVETVNELAQAIGFDKELGLLMAWELAAKAYNMNAIDGKPGEPPIAQAAALLKASPSYALRVQTDWAGGSRGRYYRDDPKKYWPLDLDAKLAPVKSAVQSLDETDRAWFYRSWDAGYYDGGPMAVTPEQARALTLGNPDLFNRKTAPRFAFDWNRLSLEDAGKLAPLLVNNPSPEASLIRAMVAAGEKKDFDKAVDALLTTEAWRLSEQDLDGRSADALWYACGRPGNVQTRNAAIKKSKAIADQVRAGDVKRGDPADKRIAAFKKLLSDYNSAQPRIPGVYSRLVRVLQATPELLPELLHDTSVPTRMLVRDAMELGISGQGKPWDAYENALKIDTDRYSPCFNEQVRRYYGGLGRLKNDKDKYVPHPLEPVLREALADQLKRGQVETWLVLAWLNTQFPEGNADSVKLAQALLQSPTYKTLPVEARYGLREWFGKVCLSPTQQAVLATTDPAVVCQPLTSLPENADAAAVAHAMEQTIKGLRESPTRLEVLGLNRLAKIDGKVFTDPKVLDKVIELVGSQRTFDTDTDFDNRLLTVISNRRDARELHLVAPHLWRFTEVYMRSLPAMIDLADALAKDQPSAAHAWAICGLRTFGRYRSGHHYFDNQTDIPRLTSIRGKADMAMGLIDIPVPKTHPAYGIYKSQAEFVIGNHDSAIELYRASADQLAPVLRKLTVPYLLWVLQYTIDQHDQAHQEELAKALLAWMNESQSAFTPEQRVALEIAYGDIAVQRGLLPEAIRLFTRIENNPQYDSVFTRHTATLRKALVQRMSGDYDGALQTLTELESLNVPSLTTQAHYARAEVFYAMEDYDAAGEEVKAVLERDPNFADATILLGRVQLKRQKLIDATELEVGSATSQENLVPGEDLKVTLSDPTLGVSGGATDIEVVVWATSGDRELVLLRQFGDQKTKYRGVVKTALGKPVPGDQTLQVVGDDEVFYAYSEGFRAKMKNLGENRGGPIKIASDAIMMASARRLLTENEQRVADMRAATEALESKHEGDMRNADPELVAQLKAQAAQRARNAALQARIKPGNPIHVRVIDPDKGRTSGIDELNVSVSASSGDTIGQVTLKETDAYSGVFEGQVPTAPAQALATASSTEAGRNPNMVISPNTDYPAWRPVPTEDDGHYLTVDLNDNAALGDMHVEASDKGYTLKQFLIRTAVNPDNWTTVASYPHAKMFIEHPWQPSVTVVNEAGRNAHYGARSVYEFYNIQKQMASGWLADPDMALSRNVAGPSDALPEAVLKDNKWLRSGRWTNPAVVYRFKAYFYEPTSVNRRFALTLGPHQYKPAENNQNTKPEFLIAVDGRIITSKDINKLQGEVNLRPGLHRFEVWATGWIEAIGFGRKVQLQTNLDQPDTLVDCPDSFFDPSTFPPGLLEHRNAPAQVSPSKDGKGFDVRFAPDSSARLIRIDVIDHEGPVPSINHVTLTQPDGTRLLPVPEDFAKLRKNDTLEIVTGDRVAVRYVDDRFVTKGKQNHERFLDVSYTDGGVEFADIEPRLDYRDNAKKPYHETLLRFRYDEPLSLVVNDADMDVSAEPDTVTCTLVNSTGQKREIVARETGPSTGVFRAWITPVAGQTDEPDKIHADPGSALTLTYRDHDNLSPGVPYDRVATITHAAPSIPRIEVGHMTVTPLESADAQFVAQVSGYQPLNERFDPIGDFTRNPSLTRTTDRIAPRYLISQSFLTESDAPEGGLALVEGRHALIEIVAPALALREGSSVDVYVQTDAGLAAFGGNAQASDFNTQVPGTLVFTATLGKLERSMIPERGGYVATVSDPRGSDYEQARNSLNNGRFRLVVPLVSGPLPRISYANREEIAESRQPYPGGLVVKAGENIHIGVAYTDGQGNKRWTTASAKVITRPVLDVMDEQYHSPVTSAYLGQSLHMRVVDFSQDTTDERDELSVYTASKTGAKHYVKLRETDPHSGVFKGAFALSYANQTDKPDDAADGGEAYDVAALGFPVRYGDILAARYTDPSGRQTPVVYVEVAKGSDGLVTPFTKQYDDNDTAAKTQFAMAESYLEVARRHRDMGDEEQAQREFASARQMLAATVATFSDPETRAHAEYLLGTLTMEDAQATADKDLQADRYRAAMARFVNITGNTPNAEYASKAQFQIAVIYERLGEPDIAAQEYVKLAYKYPDSPNLATAMARLGTHFQRKATEIEERAKPLLAQTDNKDAQFDGQALQQQARQEYFKAAQVFERLQSRFPDNDLAGKAGLFAGQIYFRVEDYRSAVRVMQTIIDNENYDGVTLRAQAMYWAGRCHENLREVLPAYALYKRITYDFPESKWAAYARAQLSTEKLLTLDQNIEINRLEEGR
ncbi:MAG: tetratricopeptide repeat protein [Phycisphaera sp.]|nr:tetratricopeptide repeat protein [Phycisphaera sp.]